MDWVTHVQPSRDVLYELDHGRVYRGEWAGLEYGWVCTNHVALHAILQGLAQECLAPQPTATFLENHVTHGMMWRHTFCVELWPGHFPSSFWFQGALGGFDITRFDETMQHWKNVHAAAVRHAHEITQAQWIPRAAGAVMRPSAAKGGLDYGFLDWQPGGDASAWESMVLEPLRTATLTALRAPQFRSPVSNVEDAASLLPIGVDFAMSAGPDGWTWLSVRGWNDGDVDPAWVETGRSVGGQTRTGDVFFVYRGGMSHVLKLGHGTKIWSFYVEKYGAGSHPMKIEQSMLHALIPTTACANVPSPMLFSSSTPLFETLLEWNGGQYNAALLSEARGVPLVHFLNQLVDRHARHVLAMLIFDTYVDVITRLAAATGVVYCHGDIHQANILVRLATTDALCRLTFIDWENARGDATIAEMAQSLGVSIAYAIADQGTVLTRSTKGDYIGHYLDALAPFDQRAALTPAQFVNKVVPAARAGLQADIDARKTD